MAHIPLGYKIVDGCAVVDEPTVKQIKETYRYYFEGKSLVDAAKKAGFKMKHSTVKRMLSILVQTITHRLLMKKS